MGNTGSVAIRALLVDDAEALRKLLRMALEETNGEFEVVGEAGDGAEGVRLAARLRPDLVVLDLGMPRMNGLEALPRILKASPETKVVIHSAYKEARLGQRARELGAVAYLEKTIPPEEFARALRSALDGPADAAPGDDR